MDSTTSIGPTTDEVLTSAAETAADDPLDAILRQIVGGYFVLTDGQGSVSKWSEPAELLFGRPAEDVLGQSFFETLIQAPVPAAAESWRRFLEAGEAPTAAGRIDVSGQHADGSAFPMEAVFVPVKLDEGFDFSLFLEDLGFELPMNLMLQRMRAQHPVVVRALRQALEPEPQPWEGWRTAGTLVVFRPLGATPWVEAELAAPRGRARRDRRRGRGAPHQLRPWHPGQLGRRPRRRRRRGGAPAVGDGAHRRARARRARPSRASSRRRARAPSAAPTPPSARPRPCAPR